MLRKCFLFAISLLFVGPPGKGAGHSIEIVYFHRDAFIHSNIRYSFDTEILFQPNYRAEWKSSEVISEIFPYIK